MGVYHCVNILMHVYKSKSRLAAEATAHICNMRARARTTVLVYKFGWVALAKLR